MYNRSKPYNILLLGDGIYSLRVLSAILKNESYRSVINSLHVCSSNLPPLPELPHPSPPLPNSLLRYAKQKNLRHIVMNSSGYYIQKYTERSIPYGGFDLALDTGIRLPIPHHLYTNFKYGIFGVYPTLMDNYSHTCITDGIYKRYCGVGISTWELGKGAANKLRKIEIERGEIENENYESVSNKLGERGGEEIVDMLMDMDSYMSYTSLETSDEYPEYPEYPNRGKMKNGKSIYTTRVFPDEIRAEEALDILRALKGTGYYLGMYWNFPYQWSTLDINYAHLYNHNLLLDTMHIGEVRWVISQRKPILLLRMKEGGLLGFTFTL